MFDIEEYDEAIEAWKESISLQPSSPDAHTSELVTFFPCHMNSFESFPDLASAYIISPSDYLVFVDPEKSYLPFFAHNSFPTRSRITPSGVI